MECPVCLEVYKEPLLLPGCGHSICKSCVEPMISEDNFLRCPECRLVYQLKKGLSSLPRNIALERTINEQKHKSTDDLLGSCDSHPGVVTSLFCQTCDQLICLKCYFSLGAEFGTHAGHKVDTTDDVMSKEKGRLEANLNRCLELSVTEGNRVSQAQEIMKKLEQQLEQKVSEVDKNKSELISIIKKSASKLKFTVKGTIAREQEQLQQISMVASERSEKLHVLIGQSMQCKEREEEGHIADIKTMRDLSTKFEALLAGHDQTKHNPLVMTPGIEMFDTDLRPCILDPKIALALRTELPPAPTIDCDSCIISVNSVHLAIKYNEKIRTKQLTVFYKEALYKGLSEKEWQQVRVTDFTCGHASVNICSLLPGTVYRCYVTARNAIGVSPSSEEIRFRTFSGEVEIQFV